MHFIFSIFIIHVSILYRNCKYARNNRIVAKKWKNKPLDTFVHHGLFKLIVVSYRIFTQAHALKNIIKRASIQENCFAPSKYYRQHYTLNNFIHFFTILRCMQAGNVNRHIKVRSLMITLKLLHVWTIEITKNRILLSSVRN